MSFEVSVGPQQLAIHHGHTVLLTAPDGRIPWPSDKGLYFRDTRLISSWQLYADGVAWELLNGAAITSFAARIFLTNRTILTADGEIPRHTLGLAIGRQLGDGLHEDFDITNNSARRVRFNLEIAMRSDFADVFEVKDARIVRRGRISTRWSAERQRLSTSYRNADFVREVAVRVHRSGSPAVYANGRLTFEVTLDPGATWHTCLLYELADGNERFKPDVGCIEQAMHSRLRKELLHWRAHVTSIETDNPTIQRLFDQAVDDMAALRLPIEGTDHLWFVPAAGLPWFVALFGRDSLVVSLQNLLIHPDLARCTLEVLGARQARERDDYRDAQPGKILHELRLGELAHFKRIPHTPYYGTADATPLYLILLHTAWRSSGDRRLLESHLQVAEHCLAWIDDYGDLDGDGFQEYVTHSTAGAENQAWKDSGNAVVHADGSNVVAPKALCELQGYVFDAWLRMAEIFDILGKPDRASALRAKAEDLYKKFNDTFWDEELGCYVYALDKDKKKARTIASNVGHCLWSGIVPPERARRVVERLMEPDMFSGWGVRTLSAKHPAFNAYDYHMGAVWPHDNAIIAQGFRRYGFVEEANRIARGITDAGACFALGQLPELFSGLQRDETSFPAQYLGANVPQAWAAGTVFSLLQTILGFQPDAPHGRLYLDPALPDWLKRITLRNLRVGEAVFAIRFWRDGQETKFEVTEGDQKAVARRDFASSAMRLREKRAEHA